MIEARHRGHRESRRRLAALVAAALAATALASGCGGPDSPQTAGPAAPGASGESGATGASTANDAILVPPSAQRPGDPEVGYRALLSEGYVGCGIPWSSMKDRMQNVPAQFKLPGRPATNADLPYSMNRFTNADGVELIAPNCLTCHAERIEGQLVIGLGNISSDFTRPPRLPPAAMALMLPSAERAPFRRWLARMQSLSAATQTLTVGVNSADNITAVLFAHRDPATLAWSEEPLLPLPDAPAIPVDVPPWWNVDKKNALYYTAAGRGDHARMMMLASVACVDTVADARAIDAYFPDIRAYLTTLNPPAYPRAIDAALAARGESVFEDMCSECHGTYGGEPGARGPGDDGDTYPNRVVPLDEIGTDPWLARGDGFFGPEMVAWFERSFYGEISDLAPERGYVAPPLDGVWATAPYFHNGSVPTVRAVLDSASRPAAWKRTQQYDDAALGWVVEATGSRQDAPEDERKWIYDTTLKGYANTGHAFGDALSDAERTAVIEYLKLL